MEFKETYRHEVYMSRKDRSRRALFMAKLTGIALVLTIGATLRAEPKLRDALFTAGMDGVAGFANLQTAQAEESAPPDLTQQAFTAEFSGENEKEASSLPTSRIKVNRPAVTPTDQSGANAGMAEHLAKALAQVGQGG